MIIGIDASKTSVKEKTGIDNTAYQIILHLEKLDKKNTYYLYSNEPIDNTLLGFENFREKTIPFPRFWNKFRLPLALLRDKPDKFLQLTNNIPSLAPKQTAVFIHDLAFKLFPEAYSAYEKILQESAIRTAFNKAEIIIFSSQSNKADFLKCYKFPENRIRIIPLAYDNTIYRRLSNPKNPLKINSPYFIFVGRLEKRKNIMKLIEAFDQFKSKSKTNHKLVLVGKKGFGFDEIMNKVKTSKNIKDIALTGFITDEELANLYSLSEALVFPSLYEGFGLPILEAMACGTPVITSNLPTLKEVADDTAILINPLDVNDIANAMEKIAFDKNYKQKLIHKGLDRVKQFSWEKTTKQILKAIEEM